MMYRIKFKECDETLDAILLRLGLPDGTPRVDIVLTGNTAYFCNPSGYSAPEAIGKINFMQAGEKVRLSGNRLLSNKTEIGYVLDKAALHMACETARAHREFLGHSPVLATFLRNLLTLTERHRLKIRYNSQYHDRIAWEEINKRRGERIF